MIKTIKYECDKASKNHENCHKYDMKGKIWPLEKCDTQKLNIIRYIWSCKTLNKLLNIFKNQPPIKNCAER